MRWFESIPGGAHRRRPQIPGQDPGPTDADGNERAAEPLLRHRPASPRWGGAGLASAGRVLLWAFVGLVLIRGLGAVLGGQDSAERGAVAAVQGPRWPDDEARAFAVRFTHAYLGGSPRGPETHHRSVTAFLAEDLRERTAAALPEIGPGARVAWATVARATSLGRDRALITVAASTGEAVRYLTVPVARDRAGGLVVFDLPWLSAAPARGAAEAPEPMALPEAQARPITDLVTRFLTAYVTGGDRAALAYYLAPGARLVQMSRGLEVIGVEQVARDPYPMRRGVGIVALVRVRDRATSGELVLRYRLAVVERERWYVQVVAGGPSA